MIDPIEISPGCAPSLVRSIRVSQMARKQVVFKLATDTGAPVDLAEETENPPADVPDWSPEKQAVGANVGIRLRTISQSASALYPNFTLDVAGEILDQDAHPGFVSFQLTAEHTLNVGIWDAYVELHLASDRPVERWPVLLIVEPPTMAMLSGTGPLLIPEVRLALLDLDNEVGGAPFSNLLDDVEFQDIDIIFAMRRAVQLWNETPPPVCTYTTINFPYRYNWLEATCGQLLLMGAARYRRNRLAYSAGGVAIDDQSKANEYEQIGRDRLDRFQQWMMREKLRLNMSMAWGVGL